MVLLRFGLKFIEFFLDMSWHVSVVSVVQVLNVSEDSWLIELVKLVVMEGNVVLDTITVFVINFVVVKFPLEESKVVWSINRADVIGQFGLDISLIIFIS